MVKSAASTPLIVQRIPAPSGSSDSKVPHRARAVLIVGWHWATSACCANKDRGNSIIASRTPTTATESNE